MRLHDNPLGDFSKSKNDVVPNYTSSKVNSRRAFARLSASIYSMHNSNLGRALSPQEEREFLDPTYIDIVIPHEDEDETIDGRYISNELINSDIPERMAESRMDILNSIDISEEEVEELRKLISDTTLDLKDTLLKTIVPYIALDNASAIVEAIMRDGVGVNIKVDSSVLSSLNDITKLVVLNKLLSVSDLDSSVRRIFLENLATSMTADPTALRKAETGQRYSQFLHSLVGSKSSPESSNLENNPMGIIKRFSK